MLGKSDPHAIQDGDDVLINHPQFGTLWLSNVEVKHDDDGEPYWIVGDAEDRSIPEGHSPMNFPIGCVWKRSQDLARADHTEQGGDDE